MVYIEIVEENKGDASTIDPQSSLIKNMNETGNVLLGKFAVQIDAKSLIEKHMRKICFAKLYFIQI